MRSRLQTRLAARFFPNPLRSGTIAVFVTAAALFAAAPAMAATYSSTGSVTPNTLANWTNNVGGASPTNFTTAGDVFVVKGGHSMSNNPGAWTVTGGVQINNGGALTATVSPGLNLGSLTIDNGGTLRLNSGSTDRTLILNGNLVNHGLITNAVSRDNRIRFSGNATWTGSGDLSNIRVALSVDAGVTLDISGLTAPGLKFRNGTLLNSTNNGTLITGTRVIDGNSYNLCNFTLSSGATFNTANSGGVGGTFTNFPGTLNLSSGANYTFSGSVPQVTGTLMPATVNDLTFNNAAGVTLSTNTTVNGTLQLSGQPLGIGAVTSGVTNLVVNVLNTGGAANAVNISSLPQSTSINDAFGLIRYTSIVGSTNDFTLGTMPVGYTGHITNIDQTIQLVIDSAPVVEPQTYSSTGSVTPNVVGSWTNNVGGGNPANFATGGDVFVVTGGNSMSNTVSGWTVAGGVQINNGGALTANISPGLNLGSLTIDNGGIYRLNSGSTARTLILNGNLVNHGLITNAVSHDNKIRFSGNATWTGSGDISNVRLGLLVDAGITLDISGVTAPGLKLRGASTSVSTISGNLITGTRVIEGTAGIVHTFTLNTGATLNTARSGGVNGTIINWPGPLNLGSGANYTFSGSVPQVTGTLMPATVNDLTFTNAAGVTLSTNTTVTGTLQLSGQPLGFPPVTSGVTNLVVYALNTGGAANTVNISSLPPGVAVNDAFGLISYASIVGSTNDFTVGTMPVGYTGHITNIGQTIQLVVNSVPPKLAFTTAPFTNTAGVLSGTITVQLQTPSGTPINTTSNLTVNLSTTSAGGVFRDLADTTTLTSVVILTGNSSASFRYKDTTAPATPTLTATPTALLPAAQQESITVGAAAKLGFTPAPANGFAGVTLFPVVVQVQDAYGNPVPQSGTSVSLTLNGGTLASGTTPQITDGNGQATYSDLLIMVPATGLTFSAAAAGPLTGTSSNFNVASSDTYTLVLQATNGNRVPRIIGASGSIDSQKTFSGYDYFEWFGITHHRSWFKPSFSTLNPTGGVTNVASFNAASAAVRADPWRQGTSGDVYFDWNLFNSQFDADQRYQFQRFGQLGIVPMMVNTVFTDQNPLADWGNKFKHWKYWYAYVYYFASQYGFTMFEFRNEPNQSGYAQWESHWLVCADAMRKAMADVNAHYGRNLKLYICGPTSPGPYWDYSYTPDPYLINVGNWGWGSTSWGKVQTDIYGNVDTNIWNYGMYDYHRYRPTGDWNETEIANLRQDIATATNAPNATIPLLITEYNTATGGTFWDPAINKDTEDLTYGIATAQILQATATLGTNGLGDEGGFFLFKLGDPAGGTTLGNKTAYASSLGDYNYGGVTRGGACFQMYARHFRGGKPLLGNTVTSGSSSKRRVVAVLDEQRQAYYVYFSNVNGTYTTVSLNLSALDVQTNAPVTVQRVDANNTGQITDYLAVDAAKKITFGAPNNTAVLVWIPKANSAGSVIHQPPANDTYLVVGEAPTNHGVEAIMKVSLHHSLPAERRLGFVQFNLGGLTNGNRHLLRLSGRNIGTDPGEREILHLYGAGGAGWSETNLTWATAPGVGKYYTSTNTMATTTGLGSMVDIEDNYRGTPTTNSGKGLGLHGKFLGPVSFFSTDWATNYVDVTDYVKSLISSNQTQATFVIARIVRYDVNQYSNTTDYALGVYDSDGRVVEIASKDNSNPAARPALVAWPRGSVAPVFTADPMSRANATEDVAYTGQTLAGSATDADGDPLTYSKVSGPAWLSIAASGTLSGTPGNSDVGTNSWTVQVSDGITNDAATLKITVINASVATNPTNITAVVSNSTLTLSWPADHLGWILQAQTNHAGLDTNWVNVEGSSSSTIHHIPISPANPSVFYRLRSP